MYRRTLCLIGLALWMASAQAPPPAGRGGGLSAKNPALPANLFTSASTLAHTSLRHEWVHIPMGTAKLHTWIEYPAGEAKAPLLLLMHYDAGLDDLQRGCRSIGDRRLYCRGARSSVGPFQEVGGNPAALKDAWPSAIAFLNKQLAGD